jgi:formylglycine-generating enzyme required for sulfatase activity
LRVALLPPVPEVSPEVLTITSPIHLELVCVPAGVFVMGSDPAIDELARDPEQPQHTVYVPEFYIGKYPVTNAQYGAFVIATNHRKPEYWNKGKFPWGRRNHPVTCVSWRDAVAFCEWLSQETDKSFRLPTEAEWEKAARGTDGRLYPWGDEPSDESRCNYSDMMGDTTPVGQYSPQGDSPYGCADMAGNVWEWCHSLYRPYPYLPGDGREDPEAEGARVLRGGAFLYIRRRVRCAFRDWDAPSYWYDVFGFRVAVAPGFQR